jgi:creatinine amidohydrolase
VGIIQCHGGIFIMTPLVRDLNAKNNPDLMVALTYTGDFGPKLLEEGIIETGELHAGEGETSKILAVAPETVHMEKAVDFVPAVPRPYLSYGSIVRASPQGVWGQPTKATAEKGEKIYARTAELMVEELNKAFAYMESKEKFGYSDF